MSLILDALKKLDREKLAGTGIAADIAADILHADPVRPAKRGWMIAGTAILGASVAATVTYIVMAGLFPAGKTPPPAPVNTSADHRNPIAPAIPREDINVGRERVEQPSARLPSPVAGRKSSIASSKKKADEPVHKGTKNHLAETGKADAARPPAELAAAPAMKLSGIIWHQANRERCAVINGVIANEGTVIEGARVVEILPNRVRLSYNGRPFELAIGK